MRAVAKGEVPGHVANRLQAAMGPTKLFHLGADDGLAQSRVRPRVPMASGSTPSARGTSTRPCCRASSPAPARAVAVARSTTCSRPCATYIASWRYGTPDDVANLVHWLASDEARYASGQLWVLDGALTAQVQQMRV